MVGHLLQPLAVEHIGLAPWDVLDPPGIDKQHFEVPLHQQLVKRNPIDAGGLHRYRPDLTSLEPVSQSAQISAEGPEAAHVLPFEIAARGNSGPVLLRSDINARSVEVDPLELRGKRHLGLRCNANLTAPLSTSGRGAHGGFSFATWIHWDAAGAKVRSLHSPKRDHVAATRVTTDVGAFLRNHANGRAQSTNDGSVSSTHCVLDPSTPNCTRHEVTSCCSAAKRRNLANGWPYTPFIGKRRLSRRTAVHDIIDR